MFLDPIIERDIHKWYAINSRCESSGNVWHKGRFHYLHDNHNLFAEATLDGSIYSSARYGRLEQRSAFCINKLIGNNQPSVALEIGSMQLCDSQLEALQTAIDHTVSVITGGPGTGKTTIAKILAFSHNETLGLSPTGKGADRLKESIGRECYTVHRFCKISDLNNGNNLSQYDLVIVDESGMLGIDTLEMLVVNLYKYGFKGRLVFMGDCGQLPSVSPGKVLYDLIDALPSYRLSINFRFNDAEIGIACKEATEGRIYRPDQPSEYYQLSNGDVESVYKQYENNVGNFGSEESRVITIHRDDAWYFNHIATKRFGIHGFPVVCTKNNYDHMVFNGQCGYRSGKSLIFGDNEISINSIEWSYSASTTGHRSQGGQWRSVQVWIPRARFLSKEWLNTSNSRAIDRLQVTCSNVGVADECLRHSKPATKRISLLSSLIKGNAVWVF